MSGLVLSLFPGIGLLDMAFEEAGFCVVRGPDVIWGGDIRKFHPPAGVFDGVIGGPPCQMFSTLAALVRHNGHEPRFGNLIPEYERCVAEAAPQWFVMENVSGAPFPNVDGYERWSHLLTDADLGGVQPRVRRISLGLSPGIWDDPLASPFSIVEYSPGAADGSSVIASDSGIAYEEMRRSRKKVSVLAGHGPAPGQQDNDAVARTIPDMCEAQGLPRDHLEHAPFTVAGKRQAIGNGVPLPMGRAIARLVLAVLDG